MALLGKIIQALAAIIPAVLDWWAKRKAAEKQAEAETRVADIRRDPKSAWMRDFGSADKRSDRSNNGDNKTSAE